MIKKEFIKDYPIDKVIPYKRNPRINNRTVDELIKTIKRVGNIDPIEINEKNVILCGHTRYKAFKKMGLTKIDVIKVYGLNEQQEKEYRIMNNKIGEYSRWDFEILKTDFTKEELQIMGFVNVDDIKIPEMNKEIDIDDIQEVTVKCPKCGYEW